MIYDEFKYALPGTEIVVDGDQWVDLLRNLKRVRINATTKYAFWFKDTQSEDHTYYFEGAWQRDVEVVRALLETFCVEQGWALPDYSETPKRPSRLFEVRAAGLVPIAGSEEALATDFDPFVNDTPQRPQPRAPRRLGASTLVRRRARAFTLLEMIVCLMFFTILMTFMVTWTLTLFNTSNAASAANNVSLGSNELKTQLGQDLSGAVVCQSSGLGVPFYTFSPSEIGLFEPVTGGADNLVLWRYANNEIERAVITPSAACTFDTSNPTWEQVESGIESAQFVPSFDGTSQSGPAAAMPNCTGGPGTPTAPENCWFDAVTLEATPSVTQGLNTAMDQLDQTWAVSLSGSELGGPSASESATVPESPTSVVASSNLSGETSVAWGTPADGGDAITDFSLQYSSDGGQTWSAVPGQFETSPASVSGLTNGTNYVFEVAATNSLGTGPWSGPSAPATPSTTPGAPSDVVAGAVESDQAPLSWTAPTSDGGSAIVGYEIKYSSDGGSTWTTITTANAAPGDAVTGLSDTASYEFEVAAVNGSGPGAFTAASS